MNTPEQLSDSLLAACKAAGIEKPKYIMQGASEAVYHSESDPRSYDGRTYSMRGIRIDHPPYATDWRDSLMEWVEPQGEPLAEVKTIRIGEYDVPEPLRVKPNIGEAYYYVGFHRENNVYRYSWMNDVVDNKLLSKGIVHLTQEAAKLHAKALISLTKQP
jgi:hypothetical protein